MSDRDAFTAFEHDGRVEVVSLYHGSIGKVTRQGVTPIPDAEAAGRGRSFGATGVAFDHRPPERSPPIG